MTTDDVLKAALDIYCKWRTKLADDDIVYTPDDFLVYDPERKLWGSSELILHYPQLQFYIFSVYDGDDGGSAHIFVWLDGDRVSQIVHEFDSLTCPVCHSEWVDGKMQLVYDYFKN